MASFSHQRIASHIHRSPDGEETRFAISETRETGKPARYQAICTSIIRHTLRDCIEALAAMCRREDNKTPEEIEADKWVTDRAGQLYQSGCAYAGGER